MVSPVRIRQWQFSADFFVVKFATIITQAKIGVSFESHYLFRRSFLAVLVQFNLSLPYRTLPSAKQRKRKKKKSEKMHIFSADLSLACTSAERS